jgi:membrane protein involved in colicin uptake
MNGLFGGGDDGAAERAAQAQLQAQREAQQAQQAAEEKRYQEEQQRIAQEKADEKAQQAQQEAKRQQDLDKARTDNAKQLAAQQATGTNVAPSNAATTAKILAASGNPNLPSLSGTSPLNRATQAANPAGGYQGQSNTLLSQSGFNTQAPGGRKYV